MKETSTVAAMKPLEMGCIEDRDVITMDGRNIGILKGAWLDLNNWSVNALIVELHRDVVDELNIKKSMLRQTRVNIPVNYVKNVADVVQLASDMATLGPVITPVQK